MSLIDWGWNEFFAAELARCAVSGRPGRVISDGRGAWRVALESGEAVLPAGPMSERPVAGDWVVSDPTASRIVHVLTRRTRLSRKKAGQECGEQVLAANVDVLFIVAGLDGDFNLRRLERYLVLAEACGVAPVVVLNKCDLCEDAAARAREADAVTAGAAPVLLLSALDRSSVMQLHRYIEPGQTAVLAGSSGAGKSTLVNALLGADVQPTRDVRAGDSRGQHTTTARRLFRLDAGRLLIDTPGLRELAPWASAEAARSAFSDIDELASNCRFRDCAHHGEPGCAVADAVDPARLESYHKLRAELAYLERSQNIHLMQEEKRRWKIIHKAARGFNR